VLPFRLRDKPEISLKPRGERHKGGNPDRPAHGGIRSLRLQTDSRAGNGKTQATTDRVLCALCQNVHSEEDVYLFVSRVLGR
jgi:hypothetical protein